MPEQISLDDSSYSERYERAMERICSQAPWWTHREVSDPGIMLTEVWALLSDMQGFYLDQVQESHYRKYLKLLGIRPDEGECAWTWAFFELGKDAAMECIVPKGTKLLADQMVFETEEEVRLINNCLTAFYQGSDRNQADVMMLSRKNPFALVDETAQERELFSFVLREPLNPDRDFWFFVLLDERGKRNAADRDFHMVQLTWEYRTGAGWREAEAVRDDTAGLLYSGIVCLHMDASAVPDVQKDNISMIRCRIRKGEYDVMPVLYKICLNVVRVVQKDTLCCSEDVEFTENCHRAALKSYLARTGRLWILREVEQERTKEEENGKLWEDITEEVCADPPISAGCLERCVSYRGTGHIKIVSAAAQTSPEELVRQVTGIAAQHIFLPWKKLMRSSVELMLEQGRNQRELYLFCRREEPEEDRYPNAWHWEEEENIIVLGDGRHGEIPSPSEEGLRLTSLNLWEGEKGNVSVGRITRWQLPELFPHITCTNRLAGRGGRNRKKPSEQFNEVKEILLRQSRTVTKDDIQKLALETPGLMISRAEAGWKDNRMVVRVFPTYPLKTDYCAEWYRSQVEKYLEPCRLAGTRMKIEIAAEMESRGKESD